MNNNSSSEIFPPLTIGDRLLESLRYWEKKRLTFNIIVGIVGIVSFFIAGSFHMLFLIPIIIYGIAINVLYSSGFVMEALLSYYFKGKFAPQHRTMLFLTGTLLSIYVTFWGVYLSLGLNWVD